ncbi:MAG: VOC family protein [Eubacteriales bacterium]|nr:VOC family protein [Eubacteriales bacterium]
MILKDNITGVQHLGIPVADLKKTIAFYKDNLGFELIHQKTVFNPGKIDAAFLKQGDMVLECYQLSGEELEEVAGRKDGLLDHFAIAAPNLDEECEKARVKGVRLHASSLDGIKDYPTLGRNGVRGVNFVGPNKEVIELCQDNNVPQKAENGLQGWSHLAIKVLDLQESRRFYEKIGFEVSDTGYVDTPEGRMEILFMVLKGFMLELIQPVGSGMEELRTRGAGHIDHIALDVQDIEDAFAEAERCGFRSLDAAVQELPFFEHGVRFFTICGPGGEKVEFNQIVK